MRKIGIIAAKDERLKPLPWYRFDNGRGLTPCYISEYEVGAGIYYLPFTGSEMRSVSNAALRKAEAKMQEAFLRNGISTALRTKTVREALGARLRLGLIFLCDGSEIMRELAPEIIIKVAEKKKLDLFGSSLAIIDDDLSEGEMIVNYFKNQCRYITIVTKNMYKGQQIADKALGEYGIPIEVTSNPSAADRTCDIAIINSSNPLLGKKTIVVDATGRAAHSYHLSSNTGGLTFDWAKLSGYDDSNLPPFEFESLELHQALRRCGVRKQCSITALYCRGRLVTQL